MSEKVPVNSIRVDSGAQLRKGLNWSTVAEYAERMLAGDRFPPVDVFFDGENYWLASGFHRVQARKTANQVPSGFDPDILANIHEGTQRDAILFSAGENATHGLPRTNEDKRRAVLLFLEDPEWSTWGDNEIARRCLVSQPFVSKLRKTTNNVISKRTYQRNGTTATMNTANIGGGNGSSPLPGVPGVVTAEQVYKWLRDYRDDKGRTWRDLTDNQTWHTNSPCWQAFIKSYPKASKTLLKQARRRLEAERQAAAYASIHKLESCIRDWIGKRAFPLDMVWRVTLPKLAELKSHSDYWQSLTETLPQPWRVNDVVQALHNVKEQLRQECEQSEKSKQCPNCKGSLTVYGNQAACEPCALRFRQEHLANGSPFWLAVAQIQQQETTPEPEPAQAPVYGGVAAYWRPKLATTDKLKPDEAAAAVSWLLNQVYFLAAHASDKIDVVGPLAAAGVQVDKSVKALTRLREKVS